MGYYDATGLAVLLLHGVQLRDFGPLVSPAMTRISPTACTDGRRPRRAEPIRCPHHDPGANKPFFQSLNDNANSWRVYVRMIKTSLGEWDELGISLSP